MASTYSPNLRLELIGTGEQQGTWGSTTNTNLGTLLEEAIGGYVSVAVTDGADTTLTTSNGSADQSRNMVINLTGALTATRNVICPAIEKLYVVKNATTGNQSVVFKVSGQTGVTIPNGTIEFLYVDGTDARTITGSIASQDSNNVSITGGSLSGVTVSNTSLSNVSVVANASSLRVRDSDGSNVLSIAVGSNLTANTVLTLTTGATSNRTLDISASNVTVSVAGAALIDDADASTQRTTLGLGTIATQNANAVSITGGSVTGITDLALADGGTGASLADPNANAVLGWNDTAGVMRFFTAGTGITINATANTISSTGGGNYVMQVFTNTTPGGVTWTKPSNLAAIRVSVSSAGGAGGIGIYSPALGEAAGGGGGGNVGAIYIPASSIPGPVVVTVGAGGTSTAGGSSTSGGTSSFGSFISITGGGFGGPSSSGQQAAGARGAVTAPGYTLDPRFVVATGTFQTLNFDASTGGAYSPTKTGGSLFPYGYGGASAVTNMFAGTPGSGYGSGGGGAAGRPPGVSSPNTTPRAGGSGTQGFIVIEEFY
jgi:hypothetical protein